MLLQCALGALEFQNWELGILLTVKVVINLFCFCLSTIAIYPHNDLSVWLVVEIATLGIHERYTGV